MLHSRQPPSYDYHDTRRNFISGQISILSDILAKDFIDGPVKLGAKTLK